MRQELTQINPQAIDGAGIGFYAECMIRLAANLIVGGVALLSLVTSGWACGLSPVAGTPIDKMAAMSGHDMSAMPANPMGGCQEEAAGKSTIPQVCAALCAVTLTVAPVIVPAVAAPIGAPNYPALPVFRSWSIQPEPYPPRA